MRTYYIVISAVVAAVVAGSVMLIPDKAQLQWQAENAKPKEPTHEDVTAEKQAALEAKIEKEGLVAATVSELAGSYVVQGQTGKAIALMERYHQKNPTDIQMLDKLAVIYHVAGNDEKYIGILEEENELVPSVNTSYTLQAHYSMLYGDSRPEKTIPVLKKLIKLQPDNPQNYKNLVYYLLKARARQEAVDAIKDLRRRFPEQIDYSFIFSLVDQLIKLGEFREAYTEAESWIKKKPDPALTDFTTMFYDAKRPEWATKLLAGMPMDAANKPGLVLLKVKAVMVARPDEALSAASAWMKEHPADSKMLEDFGNVFFAVKHYGDIIRLYAPYQPMVMANPRLRGIYRESVFNAVKDHPEYRPQAIALYEQELKDPKITMDRRKAIVLGLQEMGATKEAFAYAGQYTFKYRGDWVYFYEAMLKKQGDAKQLAAFRHQYVHKVKLTPRERRYYTTIFLDQGDKEEAERLLWQTASGRHAKDGDVQTLLFLWGVNPDRKRMNWIETQASLARGDDKLDWLKILLDLRAYDRVIRVVESSREPRWLKMQQMYFDALRIGKEKGKLKTEIASAIGRPDNTEETLSFYAGQAEEQGQLKLAGDAYDKLIPMSGGNNIEYLKKRGMVAYYAGDIETARKYLGEYYDRGGKDTLALFYFAELLQQRNTIQARPLFEETVKLMNAKPDLTLQEEVMKIHSLARLHREEQANDEWAELIKKNPDNKHLLLDYAEFFIDTREYDKAENMLGESRAGDPQTTLSQLWRIDRAHILRTEPTRVPYELQVVYDRPVARLKKVRQLEKFHPDWVNAVYPGYDRMLISARPDMEITGTFEGNALIVEGKNVGTPGMVSADQSLGIRKELLHARVEEETHRNEDAIIRLEHLDRLYPQDVGVITGLAIAHRANGQRLMAMDYAETAHNLEPENSWVNIMLADMKKEDQPYLRLDYDYTHLDHNDQFQQALSGRQAVSRNAKIGAVVENDFYHFRNLRLSDGAIGGGSGSSQRGQIDGLYEFDSGPISKTSLFLNSGGTLGLGEHVTTHDRLGTVSVFGEYRRTDWTFTERIEDHATRNRIGIVQNYAPTPDVYSFVSLSASDYSQDNKDDASKSVSLAGSIHGPLGLFNRGWEDVPVIVGYGLDAEYVTSAEFGTDPSGGRYRFYPLISREVHFVDATYRYAWDASFIGEFTGGYAYDRLSGDSGPTLAARLTKVWDDGWEAQLRASHGISFTQGGSGMTSIGGYVIHRFNLDKTGNSK